MVNLHSQRRLRSQLEFLIQLESSSYHQLRLEPMLLAESIELRVELQHFEV